MPSRIFEDHKAVRAAVPLLIGIAGPSSSGKTFSALRLATGMQRITGGEIFMLDTEARRGLHYADQFDFRHVDFRAPFSPLDYMAGLEHCVSKGAKIIVVDTATHEHDGDGGVLDWYEAELDRIAGKSDFAKRKRVGQLAWQAPKAARKKLVNKIIHLGVNMIFCYRAKEKLKQVGKELVQMGWTPIAAHEFVYEMTASFLLPPGSQGVPEFRPEAPGEKSLTKLPLYFDWLPRSKAALSEEVGEKMARWASGEETATDGELIAKIAAAADLDELSSLVPQLKSAEDKNKLRKVYGDRRGVLSEPEAKPEPEGEPHGISTTEGGFE